MKSVLAVISMVVLGLFPMSLGASENERADDSARGSGSIAELDTVLMRKQTPRWSTIRRAKPMYGSGMFGPGDYCYHPSCMDVSCSGTCSPDDKSICVEQPGCVDDCMGGTRGVPDSGACYPRY